jgi:3D (Asp-Asp-Asp) domain-containing protein
MSRLLSLLEEEAILSAGFLGYYAQCRSARRSLCRLSLLGCFCVAGILLNTASGDFNFKGTDLKVEPQGHRVTVTAYTNIPSCTDKTPNETASLLRIRPRHYGRIIALSRDLAKHYKYGDRFHLWVNGETHLVEYQDLMAKKHSQRIDLLLPSKKKCLNFGIMQGLLIPAEPASDASRSSRSGKS